ESGHWMGDYDNAGKPLQQAIWLDDMPVGLVAADSKLAYVEPDHLGTPRVVIDPARNLVVWNWSIKGEAFGDTAPSTDADQDGTGFVLDMRFPGQRYDSLRGLNQNYFRDYDAATGRYSTSDPVGLLGGVSTYSYVKGNPLFSSDLLGLDTALILSGGTADNPFGHLATAIGGQGVYSRGTKHDFGSSFDEYLNDQLRDRFVEVIVLKTDANQERAIIEAVRADSRNPYHFLSSNCATTVGVGLAAGGIENSGSILPGSAFMDFLGSDLKVGYYHIPKGGVVPSGLKFLNPGK
ncbi:RHS repeat domain-containing protein, partial [Xanthomonas arboricola]|uniref:RHS repeat domain-containing protein n=3 Tax=Xanthomonas TaxID=338 RepID=UPI000D3FF073